MLNRFKKNLTFWNIITIALFVIFGLILIYPLLSLFISSFYKVGESTFTLNHYFKFFAKKYYMEALLNSFVVSISVTAAAILIGAPLALIMSKMKIRGKALVEILIIISLLSPPFIGAYSWILLLGRSGVVTKFFEGIFNVTMPSIYGFKGIMLAFSLKLFPFIYLYMSGALKKIDNSLNEAAESLGSSGLKKIVTVTYPLILPTILAGSLVVFMRALADFGTPMLIGEGYRVMPVLIYNEFISEVGGEANFAAAMSVIIVLITSIIFIAQKKIVERKSFAMNATRPMRPEKVHGWKNVAGHSFVYLVVFFAIIPQLTVIYTSFLKTKGAMFVKGFSLDSYARVVSKLGTAVANTYKLGFIAIIIIVVLGMFISYISVRKKNVITDFLDTIVMFPYIIPGSVMGITILLAFNKQPLLLSGTAAIIIIAFVLRRLPYTVRSSAAILYQISPSLEEASLSLGYSPFKTFTKVTMIMMLPGVMAGAILSWVTLINELSASIILYTGLTKTMSVAIYTEIIRASYGTAAALSTILTLTTVVSLLIFFKLSGSREVSV